ncbi:PDZ domain-containing protein [Maribellus luteus]|uniref:PDZ domain-containing protein n=2 Tax=Maribellus luteus TaxID=2305463 RepID=A0A399T0A4_9BACT|nr:PDZ domain-containing protein [Maribellus luteus]
MKRAYKSFTSERMIVRQLMDVRVPSVGCESLKNNFNRMRKVAVLLLNVLVFLLAACQPSIFEIYVSPGGDDSANGSKTTPVATLGQAVELARAAAGQRTVHVLVEDGTYYLPQTLKLDAGISGTAEKPVVFRTLNPPGEVVISGGQKLELDWKPYRESIFCARISEDVDIDQLYINGQRQRMARFPNAVPGKNVFDAWDLEHTREPEPGTDPLTPERIASWENPAGAFIHAMHMALWGDMHWVVKAKNADGTLDMEGGWQNNRPSQMHPRYRMVENVFEELDAPGEWYYNETESMLYYFPLNDEDISKALVEIVRLKHLLELNGTKEEPVKHVQFDGFVFRHAARSFMENREPLLRSDWTTYRGGAVFINGAEDCLLQNCEFDQVGGNSIFVSNYNRRITIKSCYLHHSGANGVAFVGDPGAVRSPLFRYGKQDFEAIDRTPGPKSDNYPSECLVEDCLITMTGRDEKQTAPVQISMSHKIRVNHCSIYDVPRAGINISEGTFGGHIIENCDVFNTVLETSDHGSFNSWGRDRFWTPDTRQTDVEVKKDRNLPKIDMLDKNIIRNSRWRCDHGWDIDLDDGSTWYEIHNNVLLSGGLKMREGYYRTATNNIIINNSLHPHVWYPESGDVFKHNIVFGAYRPAVMNYTLGPDDKWGQELDSNLFATGEADRLKFAQNDCDAHSVSEAPLFADAAHGDYTVSEQSPALKIGFRNFPMDQFGVKSERLKKLAKTPDIPQLITERSNESGKVFSWKEGKVKNIETMGEQSAAGLPAMAGVAVLEVPENTGIHSMNLRTGDVILKCNGQDVANFDQLVKIFEKANQEEELVITIFRNQKAEEIRVSLANPSKK